ncbi:MAG: J domain-containing protein [Desulfobacteraceae bacterium]|nr:J domain-containing protein [Desulfobacteraceae bacterium]
MLDLFERIYKIAKANTRHTIDELLNRRKTESFTYSEEDYYTNHEEWSSFDSENQSSYRSTEETNYYSDVPQQVVKDLSVFGLKPPSSFEEVRNARNREIKKYHPDRFMNDPEKLETAKEIMQTINAAYDRLEEYYKNK